MANFKPCGLALVCVLLLFHAFLAAAEPAGAHADASHNSDKRILLLSSYHLTHSWTAGLIETIMSDTQQPPNAPQFDIDDYDAMRNPSSAVMEQLWSEHLIMLKSGQYDLLVLLDDPVIELVLRHRDELPPNLPVVFAGLESNLGTPRTLPPNFTGVFRADRPEDTLRTAAALYPNTKKILVISDASQPSLKFESQLKAQNLSINGITPEYLNTAELSQDEIFRRLSAMPPDTILMLSPWRGLYGNGYRTMAAFAADLRTSWKRPFFVNGTALLEHGALGGYVCNPVMTGHAAAKLISAVLKTGSANGIMPVRICAIPEFDYKELTDNGLDPRQLPHDAILRNRPPTIWDRHRTAIIAGGVGVLLAGCCAIGLLGGFLLISKRNAKRVKDFYFSLPARVGAIAKDERLLYISADSSDDNMVKQAKRLKEIPGIDYEKVSAAVKRVFATGQRQTLDYFSGSTRRSISIARLPSKIFGEDAVVWLSHDNSELREARKQAEESSSRLREQLELWNMVIDALPIMIFIKRPTDDFRYTLTNRFFNDFVGRSAAEVVGKNDAELFQHRETVVFRAMDITVMENGQRENEESATDWAGKLHSLRTTKMPFVSAGGERLLLGMTVDISELNRRINEHKLTTFCLKTLLQEKTLSAGLFEVSRAVCNHFSASRSFIMQFDTNKKTITNCGEYVADGKKAIFSAVSNHRFSARPDWAERLRTNPSITIRDFSKSKHEEFGISWMPLIEQAHLRSMYVNRLMLKGRVWGYAALTFEDDVRELDDGELALLDDLANFINMMLERDRVQRELIALLEQAGRDNEEKSRLLVQAQAADKAKSFFIASVSHEIRTPLNAVIGFADLLRDELLPPDTRREYLESISYSGNALLQLINDVLDLSKLEADHMELTPEPMRFADTAEDTMRVFTPKAAKLGLKLELEIGEMPELLLDKSRIRQILFNLIGNAVKFLNP
ncbi:MAG: histidine kinase dimerization/phospho-acceptor domain-containing protein [Victivallaceae bacterium]|nr:histidine kinase dimerization/phospho-acceptor domain-containing protein [Victivallaceae bacterium]